MRQPTQTETIYFAADPESEKCVSGCIERVKNYFDTLKRSGRAEKIRANHGAWQGFGPRGNADASRINPDGEQGERLKMNVNHFASLANQAVVLVTSQKPAIRAVPISSDFEAIAQAQFADALTEAAERDLQAAEVEADAALAMVLLGETAIVHDWDATLGKETMPDEQDRMMHEGDVRIYCLTPFEYVYDLDAQDSRAHRWFLWKRRMSRWDLAAQHPSLRDDILGADADEVLKNATSAGDEFDLRSRGRAALMRSSDQVAVWELRHVPSPACPSGRIVRFISPTCVLYDSFNAQGVAPDGSPIKADVGYAYTMADGSSSLMRIIAAPERIPGLPDGHTSFFDLLSLQEGVDLGASIVASAINSGGLQNFMSPRGANVQATRISGALNLIEYDGQTPPFAKDNVAISPHVMEFAESCIRWMRQRVSLNDVVVGEPSKGMPAQAMALLRAQAVEFHSRLQAAYWNCVEGNRTNILKLYQMFVDSERVVAVAGKSNRWASRYFSAKDIKNVSRYAIEPVPAALRTSAGRVAMAQPLLESGRISFAQYLRVLETGRDDSVMGFSRNNEAYIQSEKELLMEGIGLAPVQIGPDGQPVLDAAGLPMFQDDGQPHVRPLITDTHWLIIPEILSVLASPEARGRPDVFKAVSEVVHLRTEMWRAMDLAIRMLLGGPEAPPPVMGVDPTPMGPASPQGQGPGGSPRPMGSPGSAGPSLPGLPKPPKNPITGEQDQRTGLNPAPVGE